MKKTTVALTILAYFALAVMVVFAVAGCGQNAEEQSQTIESKEPAETADVILCPVMGEKVKDVESASKSVYDGKTYYFCCPGCKPKFDADPEKYIGS